MGAGGRFRRFWIGSFEDELRRTPRQNVGMTVVFAVSTFHLRISRYGSGCRVKKYAAVLAIVYFRSMQKFNAIIKKGLVQTTKP